MRETKAKRIGNRGHTYHVTQFGAREGGRVLVRLLKMLGVAAGSATEASDKIEAVGRVISNLAESVSEEDFDYLCDKFAPTTAVSGGKYGDKQVPLHAEGIFDLHFAGQYAELGQWLVFTIETNYSSFLPEGGFAALLKKASADPPGSEQEAKPDAST